MPSRLEQCLQRALKSDTSVEKPLQAALKHPVKTTKEARLVCRLLDKLAALPISEDAVHAPWKDVVFFFQQVSGEKAAEVLRVEGLPRLYEVYDRGLKLVSERNHLQYDLDFLLKLFAIYGEKPGIERVVAAARSGFNSDGYMWATIFPQIQADHPYHDFVLRELSQPLPPKFIGVAFLDWANHHAIAGKLKQHPFDSPDGKQRLHDWLASSDPKQYSYAHSATAALPFISNPERDQLLALAMDHQDEGVQMEAAWASGKLGSESGLKMLGRFCLNLTTAKMALNYLEELQRPDRIPSDALDPDFQAKAELCSWLMHPNEFGEPPADLDIYDKREMYWPPTDDVRTLWLFRFKYSKSAERDVEDVGLGLVGSVTFSLFDETTPDMDPLDAYALHCCWELERRRDRRAPKKRSIAAGRKILREYNS